MLRSNTYIRDAAIEGRLNLAIKSDSWLISPPEALSLLLSRLQS
jgi:hypothetical protein